jgi:hypothetical protein
MPSFMALMKSNVAPAANAGFPVGRDVGGIERAGGRDQLVTTRRQRLVGVLVVPGRQVTGQAAGCRVKPFAVFHVGLMGSETCRRARLRSRSDPAGCGRCATQHDPCSDNALHETPLQQKLAPAQGCIVPGTSTVPFTAWAGGSPGGKPCSCRPMHPWQRQNWLRRSQRPWPWQLRRTCRPWR